MDTITTGTGTSRTGAPRTATATPVDRPTEVPPAGVSRKLLLAGLAAAMLLLLGWYALDRWLTPAAAPSDDSNAQTVTVIVPGQVTVAGTVTASGAIAARRDLPVGIAGEGGRVVQVLVDAGSWVNKGQVLAVVDRSVQAQEIASQAATVEVQEANARLAQSKLDRSLKLVANGFISTADIEQLVATRDSAVAQVRVARASLAQLRASAARLDVTAPEAGLVLTRQVEPGQIVSSASGTLFRIARDGELEMQARLSESSLARMAVGDPADVIPVGTTQHFTGHIWQLAPVIDATSRQGIARIALPFDKALRPGGFATATLRSGSVTAPVLPASAILSDANGAYVYVVGSGNKVERRAVATGEVTPAGIAVTKGLSGNERVVLRAGGFLNPGDKVKPVSDHSGQGGSAPSAP
ncbi:efflux RND transporter periplasmic adaptor subunit [Novosphingobium sp. FSW06-99]|uniref:efflux RND transporter periplasmic adaptor subunit n=1 Tax=Novosphingobium sp. FSW06-99 TaxID=1739113 RepID=UPI00076D67B1|nr:efflux RND transporter periplasmic adaptor subunit [Novosphingobium sp. FSW06-99]KUR76039.1 secretion protein HylD [Novosphingobium sp. FSW06-99]